MESPLEKAGYSSTDYQEQSPRKHKPMFQYFYGPPRGVRITLFLTGDGHDVRSCNQRIANTVWYATEPKNLIGVYGGIDRSLHVIFDRANPAYQYQTSLVGV